jgi:hypothetical protein
MTNGGLKRCSIWTCWRNAACCWASHIPGSCRGSCGSFGSTAAAERIRISYWIASGRRIIALTVFAKTKMRETAEIARAAAAMARCQQEGHSADEEDDGERGTATTAYPPR